MRKKYKEKLKRKPSILICRCCNSRHKTHKYSIRKLLSLIDTLRKVVRQKINRHKYTMTNKTEEELEEMITFAIALKTKQKHPGQSFYLGQTTTLHFSELPYP